MVEARFIGGPYSGHTRWLDADVDTLQEYRVDCIKMPEMKRWKEVYQPRRVAGCVVENLDGSVDYDYVGREL